MTGRNGMVIGTIHTMQRIGAIAISCADTRIGVRKAKYQSPHQRITRRATTMLFLFCNSGELKRGEYKLPCIP